MPCLLLMPYIQFIEKCKIGNSMHLPILEPSFIYIMSVLYGGLAMCAHRSYYASTWFLLLKGPFNICFVLTIPKILGDYNRS